MDGHVGLGPEDLVRAGLGSDRVPARGLGGRPVRVQLVGLGVHVRLRHRVDGSGRPAALVEEPHEAVGGLGVAGRAAQGEAALGAGRGHGNRPAGADLAQHLVLGHLDVVEEDLGEARLAVDLGDGPHGDAGRVHGDEEVGQPAVALGLGVGAEDAEAPFGEGAPAGPRLLPVEQPAVARRGRARHASGCRPGRCRRRARTSPGTRSRRRTPWAGGSAPSGPLSRTRAWWGPAGRCRSGSPAWGRGHGSTPPRTRATRRSRGRARRTRPAS